MYVCERTAAIGIGSAYDIYIYYSSDVKSPSLVVLAVQKGL